MSGMKSFALFFATSAAVTLLSAQAPPGMVTGPDIAAKGGLESAYRFNASFEGPTVDASGNVYFSNRGAGNISIMDTKGRVTKFRDVRSNGLVFDQQFRLIVVETGNPSTLTRYDVKTGNREVLADKYNGIPLSGMNDVTIDGKGRIWFTDDCGEANICGVFRLDPDGKLTRVLTPTDAQFPNGLVVSPDDKKLYVLETSGVANGHRRITSFDLSADGNPSNSHMVRDFYPGRGGDGMSVDIAGNMWVGAGLNQTRATQNGEPSTETLDTKAGLYEISPDGKQLGFWPIYEDRVTNVAFGGPDMRTLYVAGGNTLYTLHVTIPGTRR